MIYIKRAYFFKSIFFSKIAPKKQNPYDLTYYFYWLFFSYDLQAKSFFCDHFPFSCRPHLRFLLHPFFLLGTSQTFIYCQIWLMTLRPNLMGPELVCYHLNTVWLLHSFPLLFLWIHTVHCYTEILASLEKRNAHLTNDYICSQMA